ncbi:MAG: metallopeptidase TldD-related protein [Limnochordia bacterium]|nr:metallopeptidase TldD-related protein [Limnochordia bacterium]
MKKEFITMRIKESAARVQNSEVTAVRVKDITRKGVRVYQDGKIGIAGVVGDAPEDVLLQGTMQNLNAGIAYPYPLTQNLKDHRCYNEQPMSSQELLEQAEGVLQILQKDYPDFAFSESISSIEQIVQMRNSEGLDLEYKDAVFALSLILKERATANLFDGALFCLTRNFDPDKFWDFNRSFLEAYRNKVELPEGDVLPVFMWDLSVLQSFLGRALHGERFARGSSLFSGKLGEQLFAEKVTIELNRDPATRIKPFFDTEGVVIPNDRLALVENGRLTAVLADKKTADTYGLAHTGAATGDYDDPPTIDGAHGGSLSFKTDSEDIAAVLQGRPAVFALLCSGGDFTADGSFATPVQVSFLFDGERLVGKLPEFAVRSNLFRMLGEDYIGTFENTGLYFGEIQTQLQGYYMTIVR